MKKIKLFTDSSVNPQEKVGFGAYLLLKENNISFEDMKKDIKTKRFEDTSSTKLELQTLLWSLEEINDKDVIIEIYTDCQNIIGLQDRRERLEKNNFHSSAGKLMNNHDLYKDFYLKLDELSLSFIKVNERNTLIKLTNYTLARLSEVFDVKILGESGVKNLMNMFLANEALIKDGDIKLQGLNTLDIIKQNCDKILMWESLE